MEYSDFLAAKQFIEEKALALMSHEKKDYAKVGFPPQNYTVYNIKGRTFYSVGTNIFRGILNDVLLEAMQQFPLNFGTGNAISVIHALNKVEPLYGRTKDVIRILQNENFSYVVENVNGKIPDRILRLDLFRQLNPIKHKRRKYDFTGGLFHALKHFSFKGKPLSTGNDKNDLVHPRQIIEHAIKAFFFEPEQFIDPLTYVSHIDLNEKYRLKFIFYHEPNTKVFFIKTIHKVLRK
jgi:hypothetical protein